MIKREQYLNKIITMVDSEFIKVITGVRRSGKSYLLLMLRDYLLENNVDSTQIHYINFEHPDNYYLQNADELYTYLKEKVDSNRKCYFLFDEIQEVIGWQKLVNGLRVAFNSHIYITGSNASLLSGEMATYLTGRYIEVRMLPLSFNEFLTFKKIDSFNSNSYLQEFLEYGGFPSVVLQNDNQLKRDVLSGIYNSILFKDIVYRSSIKEQDILEKIALFLLDNIGNIVSTNKIANTIRSTGRKVGNSTIENYLNLLENSFLVYKVKRYDIRGKEYLANQAKYYVVDLGFVVSQLNKITSNRGSRIENLVFLELKGRGYDVFVGKYDSKEIDFVATRNGDKEYYQVVYNLPQNSNWEIDNLLSIKDNYKKVILVHSFVENSDIAGIQIMNIVDWLLEEE